MKMVNLNNFQLLYSCFTAVFHKKTQKTLDFEWRIPIELPHMLFGKIPIFSIRLQAQPVYSPPPLCMGPPKILVSLNRPKATVC